MLAGTPWRTRAGAAERALATTAAAMAACLHEPPQRAWRLAVRAHLDALRTSRAANRCLARLAAGRPHGVVTTPREAPRLAALGAWLREEPAPKLVFALHTGRFIVDLVKALEAAPAGLRVRVPLPARSLAAFAGLRRYAAATGKDVDFLPLKSSAARALLRADAGLDVGLLLLDLGASYGRTRTTEFFGAPAHFVAGPYLLARTLRASIVFLDTADRDVRCEGPFGSGGPAGVDGLARCFAQRMERTIARTPTRWTRWHTLPELRAGAAGNAGC